MPMLPSSMIPAPTRNPHPIAVDAVDLLVIPAPRTVPGRSDAIAQPPQQIDPCRHQRVDGVLDLLAHAVARLLSRDRAAQVGLMLVATAAGAAFGAGVLVLLLGITILYMPIVVPLVVSDARSA